MRARASRAMTGMMMAMALMSAGAQGPAPRDHRLEPAACVDRSCERSSGEWMGWMASLEAQKDHEGWRPLGLAPIEEQGARIQAGMASLELTPAKDGSVMVVKLSCAGKRLGRVDATSKEGQPWRMLGRCAGQWLRGGVEPWRAGSP